MSVVICYRRVNLYTTDNEMDFLAPYCALFANHILPKSLQQTNGQASDHALR